jgi:hypothetical protein
MSGNEGKELFEAINKYLILESPDVLSELVKGAYI